MSSSSSTSRLNSYPLPRSMKLSWGASTAVKTKLHGLRKVGSRSSTFCSSLWLICNSWQFQTLCVAKIAIERTFTPYRYSCRWCGSGSTRVSLCGSLSTWPSPSIWSSTYFPWSFTHSESPCVTTRRKNTWSKLLRLSVSSSESSAWVLQRLSVRRSSRSLVLWVWHGRFSLVWKA